jgi:ribonuclease VapC
VILDPSAVVALMLREPGHDRLLRAIAEAAVVGIGAPTLVETGMVLTARIQGDARALLTTFVDDFGVEVVPFDEGHWREALAAFIRFGKGRHPAGLNFGDCLSYATATIAAQPLLAVGEDFAKTDLVVA